MRIHSDTRPRAIAPIAAILAILLSSAIADAGTQLYTGSIQVRMHASFGSLYSIPIGAHFSYPRIDNLPAGDVATTFGSAPLGVRVGAKQMRLTTSLLTFTPPPSWSASYVRTRFSGANDTGSFSAGGAPGPATSYSVTPILSRVFGVSFSGTGSKFGGTMRLLGQYSAQYGIWSGAEIPLGAIGGSFGGVVTATGVYGGTGFPPTFFTESVWGFPWTTGNVIAKVPASPYLSGSPTAVSITAMGSDTRTLNGRGNLKLVTPFVVTKYKKNTGSILQSNAGVAILSLRFLPEPSALAQLGVGLLALAALYAASHRRASARRGGALG